MSNRFERPDERHRAARGADGASNVMQVFGQMMMLPLSVFVYGLELFVRTIQGMQSVTDDGMSVMAGGTTRLPGEASDSRGDLTGSTISMTDGIAIEDAKANPKETKKMYDKDLSDEEVLKLMRYKVWFVKRDYETAFPEVEEVVSDDLSETSYTAWKVAEFIQRLDSIEVPSKWGGGKDKEVRPKYPKHAQYKHGRWVINKLDEEDKKYLEVYFEVLDRRPRRKFRYEERQIEVLEDIRNEIGKITPSTSTASGGQGGDWTTGEGGGSGTT